MARLVQNYGIFINAEPTAVYDYLAGFPKHGEWSEGLNVEAVSEGSTEVGSEFKSVGKQFGKDVANDIKVIEAQRPSRLAFVASADGTDFLQEIDLSESGGGTRLQRRLSFDANPLLKIIFGLVIGPFFAGPTMNKALRNFKAKLEES